ncbi:hypothetical protein BJV78DRAFT_1354317 [Lactifluus subvellereus]|nr:hypothetical protein BJV78DRAFT_1354317 [Lactifluus subvellereus]
MPQMQQLSPCLAFSLALSFASAFLATGPDLVGEGETAQFKHYRQSYFNTNGQKKKIHAQLFPAVAKMCTPSVTAVRTPHNPAVWLQQATQAAQMQILVHLQGPWHASGSRLPHPRVTTYAWAFPHPGTCLPKRPFDSGEGAQTDWRRRNDRRMDRKNPKKLTFKVGVEDEAGRGVWTEGLFCKWVTLTWRLGAEAWNSEGEGTINGDAI